MIRGDKQRYLQDPDPPPISCLFNLKHEKAHVMSDRLTDIVRTWDITNRDNKEVSLRHLQYLSTE